MADHPVTLRAIFAATVAITLLVCSGTAWAKVATCNPLKSATACISQPCDQLGATNMDSDRASIIQCLLITPANINVNDCASGGGCVWQGNSGPPLVRISFELVGAGGGGAASDANGPGGSGAGGQIGQFDAWVHRGAVLTVSVGSGGGGGPNGYSLNDYTDNGGSGLYARGGSGGVGVISGGGGGGGAGSVVIGDGLFAVSGGGGGGAGGAGDEAGFNGDFDWGGAAETSYLSTHPKMTPGMDGGAGWNSCNSGTSYFQTDGGGGGGGGGGYPGGTGGFWGCDSWMYDHGNTTRTDGSAVSPGYPASGGASGSSYLSAAYGTLAFSKSGNSAGAGAGGGGGPVVQGGQGQCGRVTIWSSSGQPFQFDCNTSAMWVVQ